MGKKLFEFENFEIYQRALDFADNMYELTEEYPKPERYGLCSQLQRSAVSVANNLAEGYSRYSKKDKTKYYKIAKGSAQECVPALTISYRRKYIKKEDFDEMYKECFEISRRIAGLIKSVQNRGKKGKETLHHSNNCQ